MSFGLICRRNPTSGWALSSSYVACGVIFLILFPGVFFWLFLGGLVWGFHGGFVLVASGCFFWFCFRVVSFWFCFWLFFSFLVIGFCF